MSHNNRHDLKTAIVGAGFAARCHVAALRSLGVPVVGIVGVAREHAAGLASSCGAVAFDRLDDVIDKVDVVHICTPPTARLEFALTAIGAGKHVLIEKPMTRQAVILMTNVPQGNRVPARLAMVEPTQ